MCSFQGMNTYDLYFGVSYLKTAKIKLYQNTHTIPAQTCSAFKWTLTSPRQSLSRTHCTILSFWVLDPLVPPIYDEYPQVAMTRNFPWTN